jgi:hypothetical protein
MRYRVFTLLWKWSSARCSVLSAATGAAIPVLGNGATTESRIPVVDIASWYFVPKLGKSGIIFPCPCVCAITKQHAACRNDDTIPKWVTSVTDATMSVLSLSLAKEAPVEE